MTRELTDHTINPINPAYDMYKITVEEASGAGPATPKPEQDAHPDPEEDLMQRILVAKAYNLTNTEQESK